MIYVQGEGNILVFEEAVPMYGWPSGRWQQTVNLPSESYNGGSNPPPYANYDLERNNMPGDPLLHHSAGSMESWCNRCVTYA